MQCDGDGRMENGRKKRPLCSRLKPSKPFKCDFNLQNIPPSKQPFKTQPQIENEDVTCSPQYNQPVTKTNKRMTLSLQEVVLYG